MTGAPASRPEDRIRVIALRIEDRPGVLQRVTNCLGRRGMDLRSCAVGQGSNHGELLLWLRVDPGGQPPAQVERQLAKLVDVVSADDVTGSPAPEWAVGLFEFGDGPEVERALGEMGAQVVERSPGRILAALAGPPGRLVAARSAFRRLPLRNWVMSRPIGMVADGGRPAAEASKEV